MDCRRVRPALVERAAGEPLAVEVAAHVEACASCSAELRRMESLMAALEGEIHSALAVHEAPELTARVRRGLSEMEASGRNLPLRYGAAALALSAVLSVVVLHAPLEERETPVPSAPVVSEPAPEPVVRRSLPPPPTPRPAPKIVVPPGQEAMILRLAARAAPAPAPVGSTPIRIEGLRVRPLEVTRLRIDPLVIEPRR